MQATNKFSSNLIRKTAILSTSICCAGALFMYLFGRQAVELTYIALGACFSLIIVLCVILRCPQNPYNGLILVLTILGVTLLATTFSGGANSRFAVIIPIMPVIMSLLLSRRNTILISSLLIVYIIILGVFNHQIIDFTNTAHIEQEYFGKTLWWVMSILLALSFSLVFLDINANLTIQMESSGSSTTYSDIYDKQSTLDYAEKMLLQISNQKQGEHFLSLIIIEGVIIEQDEQKIDMERAIQQIAASTLKVINRDVDILGYLSSNQLLACVKTSKKTAARPICGQIIKLLNTRYKIRDVNIQAHFGFITVDAKVGVNATSLLSIAGVALKRSKQSGPNIIVDYADLKKSTG